jgi:O-antigen/teichoic acid export membrane protein
VKANIQKLMLGNGLAQVIQFSSILLLSRIYDPSDFGTLAQVQSVAMLISIFTTLQLHLVVPLQKSIEEALHSVYNIQTICLSVSMCTIFIGYYIGDLYLFASFLSLFLGLTNTYSGLVIYSGLFNKLAFFYVVRAVLLICLQIIFSYTSLEDGLVISTLLAEALSALYLRFKQFGFRAALNYNIKKSYSFAKNWYAFSIYGTVQEFVSVMAFYLPLFFFSYKFGDYIGGQYAMANRLVWAPIVLISSSISQVLYHLYGKDNPNSIFAITAASPFKIVFMIFISSIVLLIYGDEIITLALGNNWELSAQLIPIILIWGGIFLLSIPFRVFIRISNLQKYQLVIDAGMIFSFAIVFNFSDFSPSAVLWALTAIALAQNLLIVLISMWKLQLSRLERSML